MTDPMAKAREIVADALEITADEVASDASIDTLDAWTSIGHMRLILALEDALGKQLDPAAIVEISNVEDVAAILEG